ncbi:MAG: hypothetical protein MZV64_20495 [Ignavibacteriales bacterium]|nr:hypothetical protein [Ignavibacteriales bacterium]
MAAVVSRFQQHLRFVRLRAKAIYDEDNSLPVTKIARESVTLLKYMMSS